jgi:hypothetical protein
VASLDRFRKKVDRTITPAEVKTWFGQSRQQKLKPAIYSKIAADLNKLRWPSDPLPKDRSRPTTRKSGLWDLNAAANAAKTLLDDMPAMLSHWQEPKWSPEHQAAYKAIRALNGALIAAMPYIEQPLGPRKGSTGRKAPKDWHMPSILIAKLVIWALMEAGEDAPGVTHNSLVVRIIQKALVRMQFPQSGTLTRDAIGAHLKRRSKKYGTLTQSEPVPW